YIQHGSYPVMSPDNSTFPPNVYVGRTSLHYITTKSGYQPHDATIFPVYNPLPGNWFVAAYISHLNQHVQQEGLGHKCRYSLGSVGVWSHIMGIPVVSPGVPKIIITVDHISYFKIFIPAGTWHFSIKISHCEFRVSSVKHFNSSNTEKPYCIQNMALRARALPPYNPRNGTGNLTTGSSFTFTETEPFTDGFYYLLVVSESRVSFKLAVATSVISIILQNATHQHVVVTACIRKGRVPSRRSGNIQCPLELMLNVTSESLATVDATKLVPYPEPDMWYIAFQLKCLHNSSIVPCLIQEIMLSLDIRTQPCVFAGEPCGPKGICQETHKGLHFFTSCTCLGGYKGWGCTDGSMATPESLLLLTTLLLTLSNVFFLPAVFIALRRHLLTEALIYLATMVFSTFYHACDQDFYAYCVIKYEVRIY
ncbi:hypothetical protein L798_07174, partial [Zootermopsis nevadensis]